jgi:UDP-2-acetamido-3-amino-2,3-dideoxy-glucuronate N-acetyltransferase
VSDVVIHPTALVESGVFLGDGTRVWDNVHIRHGASLGKDCIVGEKTYIAYDVKIGNFVKLNASVYICAAVTIEDYVMISAHTVFTNDKFPRAFPPDMSGLASSDPNEETLPTIVRHGATIGANATIGCGIELGRFSMIGMGAVVTKSVPNYGLVFGNPARLQGYVCACGPLLGGKDLFAHGDTATCHRCGRQYAFNGVEVLESVPVEQPVTQ